MKEKDGVHGVIWIVNGAITRKLELRRQMLRHYRKAQTSSGMASLRCLRCTHKTVIEQLGPLPFLFLLAYFPENCGNRLGDDVPIDVIICIQSMDRLHR